MRLRGLTLSSRTGAKTDFDSYLTVFPTAQATASPFSFICNPLMDILRLFSQHSLTHI